MKNQSIAVLCNFIPAALYWLQETVPGGMYYKHEYRYVKDKIEYIFITNIRSCEGYQFDSYITHPDYVDPLLNAVKLRIKK